MIEEAYVQARRVSSQAPTGLNIRAQGKRSAVPGKRDHRSSDLKGLHNGSRGNVKPLQVSGWNTSPTQGCAALALDACTPANGFVVHDIARKGRHID